MISKEKGFLLALHPVPAELAQQFGPLFELCERVNALSHELLFGIAMKPGELPRILGTLSYLRLLQALQSAQILGRGGLSQDASVCLRTGFEALCLLRACNEKPELALAFLASDELEQLKLANANIARLRKGPHENPELLVELERGKERLEASIAASQPKKISTFELAEAGGLAAVYDAMYRTVAKYAHISPRALQEFISRDEETALTYGRDYRDVLQQFVAIAEFSLLGQGDFLRLFSVSSSPKHEALAQEYRELMANRSWQVA